MQLSSAQEQRLYRHLDTVFTTAERHSERLTKLNSIEEFIIELRSLLRFIQSIPYSSTKSSIVTPALQRLTAILPDTIAFYDLPTPITSLVAFIHALDSAWADLLETNEKGNQVVTPTDRVRLRSLIIDIVHALRANLGLTPTQRLQNVQGDVSEPRLYFDSPEQDQHDMELDEARSSSVEPSTSMPLDDRDFPISSTLYFDDDDEPLVTNAIPQPDETTIFVGGDDGDDEFDPVPIPTTPDYVSTSLYSLPAVSFDISLGVQRPTLAYSDSGVHLGSMKKKVEREPEYDDLDLDQSRPPHVIDGSDSESSDEGTIDAEVGEIEGLFHRTLHLIMAA